jgi:hypothetical protein
MNLERSRRAAHNNARWCNAVCRAHGGDTAFGASAWFNRLPSPPYYPNLVTLDPHAFGVPELAAIPPEGEVAVKDSFARLDLGNLDFAPLFEAQWIWREPGLAATVAPTFDWSVAADEEALSSWEAAWWRSMQEGSPPLRLFPPALLKKPGLSFLRGQRPDGTLAAGAAMLQGDGVAGLACVFVPPGEERAAVYAELLQAAQKACPEDALVGYESGEDLRLAKEAGFTPAGPLRVWLRRPG